MNQSAAKYNTVSDWPLIHIRNLRRQYPQAFVDFTRSLAPKTRVLVMTLTH